MSRRCIHGFVAAAFVGALFVGQASARADSLLESQFGVTPTLGDTIGGVYYANALNLSSLAPTVNTGNVDYCVSDWYGSWSPTNMNVVTLRGQAPGGGELYDVEATYFGNDSQNLYFAVITSVPPPPGIVDPRAGALIVTGDLAIDVGLNPENADGFSYDYGVNVNHEIRAGTGAVSGGDEVGSELYRTSNSDWYLGSPSNSMTGNGELTNFDPNASGFGGSLVGGVTVDYYQLLAAGDNDAATYVLEVTIDRSAIPGLTDGDSIGFSFVPGCRNDSLQCEGDIDGDPVPEPASLLLVAGAVGALGVWRRRRARRAC